MLENRDSLSVDLFRNILDAVHIDQFYPTQYSNIYDINNRKVYLYFNHNFEQVIEIDLAEELQNGSNFYRISDLFLNTIDGNRNIPDKLMLYQNYPNPFNPADSVLLTNVRTSWPNIL